MKNTLVYVTVALCLFPGPILPHRAWADEEQFRGRLRDRILERMEKKGRNQVLEKMEWEESMIVGGRSRSYLIHLPPSYDAGKPSSLVMVLHGEGANAEGIARMSQMSSKADKEGFIVVYPNGTGPFKKRLLSWNAWNCCGDAVRNKVDDVGFIRALMGKLQIQYNIDPKRIYVTGFSNGGMMAYRLGCELSEKIAAIAPVAGALNADDPHASSPVSVIIFHGVKDTFVPYEGGPPSQKIDREDQRVDRPVSSAVAFWVQQNQCSPVLEREEHGHAIREAYLGGRSGAEVVVYTIQDQGHAWPGGIKEGRNKKADEPTQEISATDVLWDFFVRHPKNESQQ